MNAVVDAPSWQSAQRNAPPGVESYVKTPRLSLLVPAMLCLAYCAVASASPFGIDLKWFYFVMDADGGNPTAIASARADGRRASWSPDGRRIAFSGKGEGGYDIYVMNSDGKNLCDLTNTPDLNEGTQAWSPDGAKIAFTATLDADRSQVYVMTADGKNPRNLSGLFTSDSWPAWAPDGNHIAFCSRREGNVDIWVMDADGGNPRNLTKSLGDPQHHLWPSWSPDSKQIAFAGQSSAGDQIFVMNADGTNARSLTDTSGRSYAPAWSPDGAEIAYIYAGDRGPEIFVMAPDGTHVENLSREPPKRGLYPAWSPDGKKILFTAELPPEAVLGRDNSGLVIHERGGLQLLPDRGDGPPGVLRSKTADGKSIDRPLSEEEARKILDARGETYVQLRGLFAK